MITIDALNKYKLFRNDGYINTASLRYLEDIERSPHLYEEDEVNFVNELKTYPGDTFAERIWNVLNERPMCKICGKPTPFLGFSKGYAQTCGNKECKNKLYSLKNKEAWENMDEEKKKDQQKRREETNLKKYGVKNPGQSKVVQEKMKQTNLKKYGTEYAFASDEIKEKIKKTNNERYGCDYGLSNPEIIKKRENTLIKRYGVSNIKQVDNILNKQYEEYEKHIEDHFEMKECQLVDKYTGIYSGPRNQLPLKTYHFKCNICGKIFEDKFNYSNPRPIACPNCFKSHNESFWEREVREFIKSLNIEFEKTDRNILNGKELDIYIPSKKVAIECDGLYYHNEKFLDKDYHLNKTKECEKLGIHLLHIFEDEWREKREIIQSIIKSALGVYDTKIGARKCKIEKNLDCKEFFDKNHLQGFTSGKYTYCLTYTNEIVAALAIGVPRFNKEYNFEILRFATKINTQVIGAFEKLFKEFLKDHKGKIITYSDRRIFTGNLYRNNGFKELEPTKPSYFYTKWIVRIPRLSMTKQKLVKQFNEDTSLTEHQIANKYGYYKIYDCGNWKFEYLNP